MRRLGFLCAACVLSLSFTACSGTGTPMVPNTPPEGTTIPTFLPGATTIVPNFAPTSTSAPGTTLNSGGTTLTPVSLPTATLLAGAAGTPQAGATSVPAFVPSASPAGSTNNAGSGVGVAGSSGTTNCTPPAGWVPYVVQNGDTLSTIAQQIGATTANLVSGNCLTNPNTLQAGQTIYLPSAPAGAAAGSAVTTIAITATPVAVVPTGVPAGSVAGAAPTTANAPGCLPQTPVPGAVPATVMSLVVQPGTVVNGAYQVNTATITLVAQNIQNAAKVRFCVFTSNAIAQIGEVAVVNNEAILQWQIPAGLNQMIIGTKAIAPDGSQWDGQSVNVVKNGG